MPHTLGTSRGSIESSYNGPGNSVDVANAISLDATGNVYVTGESRNAAGDDDFATVKYSPTGGEQWVVRYDSGPGDTFDLATAIGVDASSNVYVTGESVETGIRTITTIKYAEIPVSVEENPGLPNGFTLEQNYPNPFNPSATINYRIPTQGPVSLKVFDLLGREVATLVNEVKQPGNYEVTWDAGEHSSGIYFYRLQAGDFVQTRKLILMK